MGKPLSEMTMEELWKLFSVILKEHNPSYFEWFDEEEKRLKYCLDQSWIKRINHIGSSAAKDLLAKPTIDILLELDEHCNIELVINQLKKDKWILMSCERNPDLKLVLNKGYTPDGFAEKEYHLHVRYLGDWNELYFRDYLLAHSEVSKEYGNLKFSLLEQYKHNRDGYTEAKSDFVLKYTEKARKEFKAKYAV